MEFRDLEYLMAIAEYGNLTRAAQSLYISQPALTKTLQRMEDNYRIPLFEKVGRRYVPTYAGSRLLAGAEQILQQRRRLENEMADLYKSDVGLLQVGMPSFRCSVLLPAVLPKFRADFPQVRVTVTENASDLLDEALLAGRLNLAFYNLSQKKAGLEYTLLYHDAIYAVVRKGHPIAERAVTVDGQPAVCLEWLLDNTFLLQNRSQRLGQRLRSELKARHLAPDVLEISNVRTALLLAAQGCGVSFVAGTLLRDTAAANQADIYRLLGDDMVIDYVAAWRTGAYLPRYALAFLDLVREDAARSLPTVAEEETGR